MVLDWFRRRGGDIVNDGRRFVGGTSRILREGSDTVELTRRELIAMATAGVVGGGIMEDVIDGPVGSAAEATVDTVDNVSFQISVGYNEEGDETEVKHTPTLEETGTEVTVTPSDTPSGDLAYDSLEEGLLEEGKDVQEEFTTYSLTALNYGLREEDVNSIQALNNFSEYEEEIDEILEEGTYAREGELNIGGYGETSIQGELKASEHFEEYLETASEEGELEAEVKRYWSNLTAEELENYA
ncbi:MAG: hypothetical protein ABEJ93_01625 [Candidatus Nanohalobium sp.]